MSDAEVIIIHAAPQDLDEIYTFLKPFMDQEFLLSRTPDELGQLLSTAYVARMGRQVVGFASVEVYSKKLAELQCLAVSANVRRMGIGRRLVDQCVRTASELGVLELMAISTSEELFRACGFDYSLPNQKRALFIQPGSTAPKSQS